MAMTGAQGPYVAYGSTESLLPTTTTTTPALGGEQLDGPSLFYQGTGVMDARFLFDKEKAGGWKGVAPSLYAAPTFVSIDAIPAAHSAVNIAAANNTVANTPMTLAAPSFGAVANIPLSPITATGSYFGGAAIVTPALCLDFGFAMATTVSGSANVTVADTTVFVPGMPLVIANTATTTTPWFTSVLSITSATVFVAATTAPFSAASGAARVGTGNIWQPNEGLYAAPTAHFPAFGKGPGLFYDPHQMISRGVVVTCNSASGAGGTFTVAGYDVYGEAQTEVITSVPATALATYGVKAWKWISSVTPNTTDATYTYSVGTSDVFGFVTKSTEWENVNVCWNALSMTSSTGWTAGLGPGTASTSTTADVRGTIQTSAIGGGTGIGSTASNGSHSGTSFSGIRLYMAQLANLPQMIFTTPSNTTPLFGNATA